MALPPPNLPGHPRGIKLVSARTPASTTTIVDDEDGWWSWQEQNVNSPMVARSGSSLSLAVSLCFGLTLYAGGESCQILAISSPDQDYVYAADEIVGPVPLDDSYQQVVGSFQPAATLSLIVDDDGLPPPVTVTLEEPYPNVAPSQSTSISYNVVDSDDTLPVAATGTPDEPYQYQSISAQDEVVLISFPTGTNFPGAALSTVFDE